MTISNWTLDRLPALSGHRYLITGANSGIGLDTARHLRRAGADVIVAARSASKGQEAVRDLESIAGAGSVDLVELDLASTASIRSAATALHERFADGLDGVVNNAGVMQTPQLTTEDGFELQFGTNHLGHFLLNALVVDLVAARSGRFVPVSSIAHRQAAGIEFDDVMHADDYNPTRVYAQSKLANLMYGLELARRIDAAGSPMRSVSAHPGYSATNLQSSGPTGIFKALYRLTNPLLAQPSKNGAIPSVLAVAGEEAENGAYYGPTRFGGMRGPVGDSPRSEAADDAAAGARLWALSEELLGITFEVPGP
ncbi:MAG: oxidoreductase [Actinomycetota bacterium]